MMNLLKLAESYYKAIANKDLYIIEKYLHPDVKFIASMLVHSKENKEEILGR
jgi:hypothetical protein